MKLKDAYFKSSLVTTNYMFFQELKYDAYSLVAVL